MKLINKFLKQINEFRPLLKVVDAVTEDQMARDLAHEQEQLVRNRDQWILLSLTDTETQRKVKRLMEMSYEGRKVDKRG